ncbi:hypothetical protein [Streptomyces chromofuscus]|uniref:Uncharacterized protein n=1 Tax=Streptomyces chromofuscus TaxID=42881 RepID=A0A7M2T4W0_STRCW|nr:hypothetical protein [Streptomyces chromofuscus]QOV42521.1 hypothetical protein IPT68_22155 [Streptomyces chromofuscus]GGT30892.1 hypothetical protein GCM10010254_59350 [Streptomyces chromofuscus]
MSVGEGRDPSGERGTGGLPEELRALGRSLDATGAADGAETMVERVLGQILAEQVPVPVPESAAGRLRTVRHWTRARWRALAATVCGLLTVLALTPPVRAAVVDWFDFGGVEVRYDPSAEPSTDAAVPGCGSRPLSLAQAAQRAGFRPVVPPALGAPDAVTVTAEPQGRSLITLCWREPGGTIRLDEYPARLDVGFVKTVPEQPEWLQLEDATGPAGVPDTALWFPQPHRLSLWLVDTEGDHFTRERRTAGPTLLWMQGTGPSTVTLRLEGVAAKERALEIARSPAE